MLIIAAGMQKAGSSWYCKMVNDLLVAAGHEDACAIRDRYHLRPILGPYDPPEVGRMFWWKMSVLRRISRAGNTFVVKTHEAPSRICRAMLTSGEARAIYVYRDPRDVAISAFEHGQKQRAAGRLPIRSFARLTSMERSILWVWRRLLPVWEQWVGTSGVLLLRYEDMKRDTSAALQKIAQHLGLSLTGETVNEVAERYRASKLSRSHIRTNLHINKAVVGRHAQTFTQEQLELSNKLYRPFLNRMRYESPC